MGAGQVFAAAQLLPTAEDVGEKMTEAAIQKYVMTRPVFDAMSGVRLDDARVERGLLVTYVQLMQAFARELDGELSVLSLGPRPGQLSAQQWLKQRRVPTSGLLWQSRPPSTHTYDGGAAATASYLALEWLRALQPQCDLLAFHGAGGTAYYSLLARAQVG